MSTGSWIRIEAAQARQFAEETLLARERILPVVGLSTLPGEQYPWIDADRLAFELAGRALVVVLETGHATWALSAALPRRLDVFGGAVRIWWPGLERDSDPLEHVLFLIRDERAAEHARARILTAILSSTHAGSLEAGAAPGAASAVAHAAALVANAPAPASVATPVRLERTAAWTGTPPAPSALPDAWARIAEEYHIGDIVPGRVFRLDARYALVELLPGAGVIVPLAEIDYTWVRDPAEVLNAGERVNVQLLELDPHARRGLASIKRALGAKPRGGIALRRGDPPYCGAESAEESDAQVRRALTREREIQHKQGEELEGALDDRRRLAQLCEELKAQAVSLRKDLKRAEDRARVLEAQFAAQLDPLASESSFLAAVRVEYARRFDESDRQRYTLLKLRVGRAFLDSVRKLQGIDLDKVVEVCAQVACERAHEISGRSVHELTAGVAGKSITRAADNAQAWRCALQVGTPSARRLHWWRIPHKEGATIEFASVAVHDEYSIPG